MKTIARTQRVTERGQITLPVSWRRRTGVHAITVRERGDVLEIAPLRTEDERDEEWATVFDAVRDNGGKGIPVDDMIATLKRLEKGAKPKREHGRAR